MTRTGTLRRQVRTHEVRYEELTAGRMDTPSVKTTEMGGPRGFDAGKKFKGRKRGLVVNVLGLLVVPADVQESNAGRRLLPQAMPQSPDARKDASRGCETL